MTDQNSDFDFEAYRHQDHKDQLVKNVEATIESFRYWANDLERELARWHEDVENPDRYQIISPTESLVDGVLRAVQSLPFNLRLDLVHKYAAKLEGYRPEQTEEDAS